MPESTSSAVNIDGAARGRRHSILSDFLPGSLPFPPSFVASAPNVQEILSRDIEDCSSDEEEEDEEAHAAVDESESRHVDAIDVQLAFNPNGVAYGCGFSTIPLPGIDLPVQNPHEQGESLQAEIDLLRDNDILPPKHARARRASVVERACRTVFSTRVQDHHAAAEEPTEETRLLPEATTGFVNGLATPPPDEIHKKWDQAVAAHDIETTWQREAKTLVQYAAPLIVTFLLHYSVTVASVLTVGRLGMEELAAVNRASLPTVIIPRINELT